MIPFFRLPMFMAIGAACRCQATEYTTFLGDASPYKIARAVADSSGNTYVAGTRMLDQASEAFAAKLDPSGDIIFFRVISGGGVNTAADLAVDTAGNLYIAGSTNSPDFPVHNALQSTPGAGFLLKLSGDGAETVWSTYFREPITALAIDSAGNVYVTGTTNNPQFPVTAGLPNGAVYPSTNLTPVPARSSPKSRQQATASFIRESFPEQINLADAAAVAS